MTSTAIPVYRNGRKFYVTAEEYEQIRSQERQSRRVTLVKAQKLSASPTQPTATRIPTNSSSYHPVLRAKSNPYEYQYAIAKARQTPALQREPTKVSRSPTKYHEDRDDQSSLPSTLVKKKPSINSRSQLSDKTIDHRKTPALPNGNTDSDMKRILSAEITPEQVLAQQQKQRQRQQTQLPTRRAIPAMVSDYGVGQAPTSLPTSYDQTYAQMNSSRLTSYFARMKHASLNIPSRSSPFVNAGTTSSSLFETTMQGFDNIYTVVPSPGPRSSLASSSLMSPSIVSNGKNECNHRDTTNNSIVDESLSSLSTTYLRRNAEPVQNRRAEYTDENDDNQSLPRESWTRSTIRSQSSDGVAEKKRVRFADTEGFTLEIVADRNSLRSIKANRLLARRQNLKMSNDSRDSKKQFFNSYYQVTSKAGESKLVTDV